MEAKRRLFLELFCVSAGTLVIAYALRLFLPKGNGFTFTTPTRTVFLSSGQLAFWAFLIVGVLTSSAFLIRAVMK